MKIVVKQALPKITVIIPHWNGEAILRRCLISLRLTGYENYEILVVDNGSTDQSVTMIGNEFPEVKVAESPVNLGFAAGCNLGITASLSPYVALLNNDAEVTAGWLTPLVELAESDPAIAAVQPKILSVHNRQKFDYCGAAGGEIDIFGYPFAWGRLFDTIENDQGRYDQVRQIFWATGAAKLIRRAALNRVGLFDETFFAHMEEIDLDWRMQLAGYKIYVQPDAVVYHQTGGTLAQERIQKMILNHRNSLLMLIKNYQWVTLLRILPVRFILEFMTVLVSPLQGNWKRSFAVIRGLFATLKFWPHLIKEKKKIAQFRILNDQTLMKNMYRGSVALSRFLKRIKSVQDLHGFYQMRIKQGA